MGERKAFLLYTGYFEQIEMLSIEQRGILLTAIMAFQTGAELPEMDAITKMAYSFISADMRRDSEKYEEVVEKRRESGRKGGYATQAKRANARNADFASNFEIKQNQANQANQAVYVDVDVEEDVKDKDDVYVDVKEPSSAGAETDTHTSSSFNSNRPTNPEIAQAIIRSGYSMDKGSVIRFIKYNDDHGWKMDLDEALKRWNQKELPKRPGKKTFLNNGMHRSGSEREENDENIAKLIAMQ